ncbi:hypothetical protein CANARDRAFT_178101 [[Candida] arabinofermentans NRRL YB-2248]|uniref:ZIP zinc/iron transport family n=1 Tax=[Candida] arabinofermentans NRRL YB-2248 TaxID=983967 RepID=A0A1E4STZ2_9ASCO|nr:hypothetical protein CANARDRAFT_178101 [[Candida] arabinofermentans NRRL YB-2248]
MSLIIDLLTREDTCASSNDYNGDHWNARISSIFVVLIGSAFGSFFPILSSRYSFIRLPNWCFFITKFFGSGVIVATAFIHLLSPASDNLGDECLGEPFTLYPFAFGICLITLMMLFFAELVAYRYMEAKLGGFDVDTEQPTHTHSHFGDSELFVKNAGHEHNDKQFAAQLLNVSILEFGIVFHSIFVGLTLAISGKEFTTLYIVVVFHQLFEGLGLGTRIALIDWPKNKRLTPWLLAFGYTLCTPIAIGIGLGVRNTYVNGSRTALITNGVFDSVSSGILIYTGLIELMAHEFLFGDEFKGVGGLKKMCWAYLVMCCGAGLMALLGRWA